MDNGPNEPAPSKDKARHKAGTRQCRTNAKPARRQRHAANRKGRWNCSACYIRLGRCPVMGAADLRPSPIQLVHRCDLLNLKSRCHPSAPWPASRHVLCAWSMGMWRNGRVLGCCVHEWSVVDSHRGHVRQVDVLFDGYLMPRVLVRCRWMGARALGNGSGSAIFPRPLPRRRLR